MAESNDLLSPVISDQNKAQKLALKFLGETRRRFGTDPTETLHVRDTSSQSLGTVTTVSGPALIEPHWGYVITKSGRWIEDSLRTNWPAKSPPWRFSVPWTGEFLKALNAGPPRVRDFDEVILLRDHYEWNYFHFHFDVLGRLGLFAAAGIPEEVPIVLGRYAIELPFVQAMLAMGGLGKRRWILQDQFYVRAKRIYYGHTTQTFRERAEYFLDRMDFEGTEPEPDRRVFLNRATAGGRRILNIDAVREVVVARGFAEVDAAALPYREQVRLFRSTRHLVAIHGAGITNTIYRRGHQLSLLELYPSNFNSFDYRTIATAYGWHWAGLAGVPAEGDPQLADFTIDIPALELAVASMLDGA
ncbi:MAG: glycosyltransferase family 61 protein [Tepidiformaceae bacterium]